MTGTWICYGDLVFLGLSVGLLELLSLLRLPFQVPFFVLSYLLQTEVSQLSLLDFVLDVVELLVQSEPLLNPAGQQFVLFSQVVLHSLSQSFQEGSFEVLLVSKPDHFVGEVSYKISCDIGTVQLFAIF